MRFDEYCTRRQKALAVPPMFDAFPLAREVLSEQEESIASPGQWICFPKRFLCCLFLSNPN